MKITQDVRAFAMEQAGRRCECTGKNCRHHLSGARCKRGLRGDDWKVFWRKEDGGLTRENIEAWCLECFSNNFEVPKESVALLATDIFAYARLLEEDRRRAITLKSVLRDAADRAAQAHHGRLVLDRLDDDVLAEFPTSSEAVQAAQNLRAGFAELAVRLDLPVPDLCGAIHYGEVTRWRNGLLAGEAVSVAASVRCVAELGRIVLTGPAAEAVKGKVELEPMSEQASADLPPVGDLWALRL
ncbi:MAG: hypothetical protein PVJ80_08350 [Gemmatimonadota bacterium]